MQCDSKSVIAANNGVLAAAVSDECKSTNWELELFRISWRLCDDKLVLVLMLKADSSDLIYSIVKMCLNVHYRLKLIDKLSSSSALAHLLCSDLQLQLEQELLWSLPSTPTHHLPVVRSEHVRIFFYSTACSNALGPILGLTLHLWCLGSNLDV